MPVVRRTRKRLFSTSINSLFHRHVATLTNAHVSRRESVALKSIGTDDATRVVTSDPSETLGVRLPSDKYAGCTNLRTLRALLALIDDRGFERSAHQMQFHSAFERCVSRVVYKGEWGSDRPNIMKLNGWQKCSSEVMISTPRRFGKTFSIAIFVACLACSFGCEVVIFSPARRASRKLLERIVEFIRLLDLNERIIEYNQEQCRVKSYDGRSSLIRSFPSKVGVSALATTLSPRTPHAWAHASAHILASEEEEERRRRR